MWKCLRSKKRLQNKKQKKNLIGMFPLLPPKSEKFSCGNISPWINRESFIRTNLHEKSYF